MQPKSSQKTRIILSNFLGLMGSGVFSFGIGLLILRETGSASNFGFSQIVGPLVSLILLPFTGSIIDRYNRKYIVVVAQICSILGIGLFLLVNWLGVFPRLMLIYILLTILEVTDLFLRNTYTAALITMVEEDEVQQVISAKQMVQTIAMLGAPVLGAFLYTRVRFETFVFIEILSEIATLLVVLTIRFDLYERSEDKRDVAEKGGVATMIALFREGFDYIRSNTGLRFMAITSMLLNFIFSGMSVGIPFIKIHVFHFTTEQYGYSEIPIALGMLAMSYWLSKKQDGERPLNRVWKLLLTVNGIPFLIGMLIFLDFSQGMTFVLLCVIMGMLGILLSSINIPLSVWSSKMIPTNMQGRVSNLISTCARLLIPIGVLFYGALFDYPLPADRILFCTAAIGLMVTLSLPKMLNVPIGEM